MKDIGTYTGPRGLERLLQEIRSVLRRKERVVVAVAGLPGAGKTYLVKRWVRLGFGPIRRRDILVIDDNTIYSTRFWRLEWEKIRIAKGMAGRALESTDAPVIIFSNWIPSRFLDCADIYVTVQLSEDERISRLKRREKKAPEKFLIQKGKNEVPLEEPFTCPRVMTLVNDSRGMTRWHWMWAIRRIFSSRKEGMKKVKPV